MITASLRNFCDRMVDKGEIDNEDVRELQEQLLPHGLSCREDAAMLIILDRLAPRADAGWVDFLVSTLVEFVVWTSRPTGYVDEATARWLLASISGRGGATESAARAVFEIVREAEQVHESLLAFAMQRRPMQQRPVRRLAEQELAA